MMGEIGGNAEEKAAELKAVGPVHQADGRLHRRSDRPPGKRMGHAGAIISGGLGQGRGQDRRARRGGHPRRQEPGRHGRDPAGRPQGTEMSRDPDEPRPTRTTPGPRSRARGRSTRTPGSAVREDRVLRPDGLPGIYGVRPLQEQGNRRAPRRGRRVSVWLVGQYRYPLDASTPGRSPRGVGPRGEEPEQTARRELKEETGLVAGSTRADRPVSHLSNSVSDELAYLLPGHRADAAARASPRGPRGSRSAGSSWPESAWAMVRDVPAITDCDERDRPAPRGHPPRRGRSSPD